MPFSDEFHFKRKWRSGGYGMGADTPPSSPPAGFYVATTGSNVTGTGTFANPWGTIQFALGQLSAGDTLWIRSGTYQEKLFEIYFSNTGTVSNRITISAYTGETVTLKPFHTNQGNVARFQDNTIQYVTVKNLIFDGADERVGSGPGDSVLSYVADFLRFENCTFQNGLKDGVQANGDSAYFLNCNFDTNGTVGANGEGNGFYGSECTNTTLDGGRAYNNKGNGVRFWTSGSNAATGNIAKNMLLHQNGNGKGLNGLSDSTSGGCGLNLGDHDNSGFNLVIYNNNWGFQLNNTLPGTTTNQLLHCTVTENLHGMIFETGTTTVKNTISYNNGDNDFTIGAGSVVQTTNQTTNPSFKNPATRDYRLAVGSSAAATGTYLSTPSDVLTDLLGVTRPNPNPCKGAYEGTF